MSCGTVAVFSSTVLCGNSPTCWMTYPMCRRSSTGSAAAMSSPPSRIRPEVGSMSRFTIFIVVVLPQPDGPTSVTSSPSATSKDRSSTAVVPSG